MKLETVAINKLKPDPKNARMHDVNNIKVLSESLSKFGQRKPIVLDSSDVIIAGNGTVDAAKYLGWTEIEVVRIPKDWTPEMIRAFAIADNRTAELSQFNKVILTEQLVELQAADFDIKALGFTEMEVDSFSRISSASVIGSTDAQKEWAGMPEYQQSDKNSIFHITVHFATEQDIVDFFDLIQMNKSKSFWYPQSDGLIGSNINEQYVVEN